PSGTGRDRCWDALLAGRSGIGPVRSFDTTGFAAHIGAEVRDFEPAQYLARQKPEAMGRASQMAIGAARLAWQDSGIDPAGVDRTRVGVAMGTTSGEPLFV